MAGLEDGDLSLSAEKRRLTEERILRATMAAMAERGFSVTVEEIASVAGVTSRTIYRYFDTHDQLIAAGMRGMLDAAGEPIPDLPSIEDDLEGWIDRIAYTAQVRNATIFGAAFWDMQGPGPAASKEIQDARVLRRTARLQWMNDLAAIAWTAAGGEGPPPSSILATFALALSAFTFYALAADFDYGPEATAHFTASMIKDRLTAAVDAQRRASGSA